MNSKILDEVIADFERREQKGIETYLTTMDREDLSTTDWIVHLQEELMDAVLYLKKLEHIQKRINNDKFY